MGAMFQVENDWYLKSILSSSVLKFIEITQTFYCGLVAYFVTYIIEFWLEQ